VTPNPDDFDLDVEVFDSTQAPTHIYVAPARPYRVVAGSVVVTTLLVAVLTWSMRRAESRAATPAPAIPTPVAPVTPSPLPAPAAPPAPATTVSRHESPAVPSRVIELIRPRRISALLSLSFAELRPGAALATARLIDVLGDGVTVVNLWATYCAPCLRELPTFSEIATRDHWGREVRFVPVMVDQLRPADPAQKIALEQLRQVTANHRLLVDPGDELGAVLRASTLYDGPAVLPVTLTFHCDELAWAHFGELDPSLLTDVVQRLRRLPRCERPERPAGPVTAAPLVPPLPAPAPLSKPSSCGDGRCDRTRDETCASCRADCGCPLGTSCTPNASGATHCARDETALKD